MTLYWLLLAFPAMIALLSPLRTDRHALSLAHGMAMMGFVVAYTLLSLLRFEVGGDWGAYEKFYQTAQSTDISGALGITDPLFSLLLWVSALLGTGIYFANALCSLLLVYGVVRIASGLREPWLAIAAAVPYILIVVGMGYVRQAGSIGMVLIALSSLERGRNTRTIVQLIIALGFHSTSIVVFPFFAFAMARRNQLQILLLATVGSALFFVFAARQFDQFDAGYIAAEYQSDGALVRIMLSVVASLLLLARWRRFRCPPVVRPVWIGFALTNVAAFIALAISPSSTAIDRISLYFSVVQIFVFGNIAELSGLSRRGAMLTRVLVIAVAIAVQLVWLVFANNAGYWVPYKSVLSYY